MGATVYGILSRDDIDTLKKFSTEACRDQLAVLSDAEWKNRSCYDAGHATRTDMANRISYVIDKDGKVVFAHQGSDPVEHVQQTMDAVKKIERSCALSVRQD